MNVETRFLGVLPQMILRAHVSGAWPLVLQKDKALLHSVFCAWTEAGDSAVCAGVKEYEGVRAGDRDGLLPVLPVGPAASSCNIMGQSTVGHHLLRSQHNMNE